jgi:hypothetical protein
MTIERFHIEFKITLDKLDSSAYSEILEEEIDYYLNEAQERFVKQRYYKNNNYRKGFEEIQKRTDDLKNLVISRYCDITPVTSYDNDVHRADIDLLFDDEELTIPSSDNYMFYVKAIIGVNKNGCSKFRRPKLIQQDDLATLLDDPFNKPSAFKPVIFFEDGDIFVCVNEEADVESVFLTFIKRPIQMNLGTYGEPKAECELSEHTHKEIVQIAAQIAIENIESPRIQTQTINVQQSE